MKELLATKGIGLVSRLDDDDFSTNYIYSRSMLKKRIFIELSEAEYYTGDNIDDWELASWISVFFLYDETTFDFTIWYDNKPTPPINLYRMILDLVDIIDSSNEQTLMTYLKIIATSYSKSTQDDESEAMVLHHRGVQQKIEEVQQLIELDNALNN